MPPLQPWVKLTYFSSLMLFFSVCAETGNLSFPSETFLQAIRLCKHQSDVINYAGQREIEREGGREWQIKKREREIIWIRLPSLLDLAFLWYLLVFTIGKGINISSQIESGINWAFIFYSSKPRDGRCTSTSLYACRAKCSRSVYVYMYVGV